MKKTILAVTLLMATAVGALYLTDPRRGAAEKRVCEPGAVLHVRGMGLRGCVRFSKLGGGVYGWAQLVPESYIPGSDLERETSRLGHPPDGTTTW